METIAPEKTAVLSPETSATIGQSIDTRTGFLILAALGLFWFILINELRIDWTVNPQYSYGWVVPFLALGLLFRRWQSDHQEQISISSSRPPSSAVRPPSSACVWVVALSAFLILPARLLLEATPGWRTLNIALAAITISVTLILTYVALGKAWTRQLAFPVFFILVAVPWPFSIEKPLIQGLTQANAAFVIEIMGFLGIPAVQHGNVIEVGTGVVGIDEACSGIRSFQSSLMISLFMGEFYRLNLKPRFVLVPLGFFVAFGFNVVRTTLLTWIASKKGIEAIAEYHDQAGLTILLACSGVMWAAAGLLAVRGKREGGGGVGQATGMWEEASGERPGELSAEPRVSARTLRWLAGTLLAWLLLVQVGVEAWYRAHETGPSNASEWTLTWPPQEAGFREVEVGEKSREMLKYDEGRSGTWTGDDGASWKMYYFRWLPGRLSVSSARSHNPSVCLVASGKNLHDPNGEQAPISVAGVTLPFRRYEFTESGQVVQVFHCLWEEHARSAYFDYDPDVSAFETRVRAALEGRRNQGQRSIEILLSGPSDPLAAQALVKAQLEKMITVRVSAR